MPPRLSCDQLSDRSGRQIGSNAAWARFGNAPSPVAWLLADEPDDVQAFWTQVLGALTVADALPDDNPLRGLLPGAEFGLPEVARIGDELARLPAPVMIVIDDLHRITKPAVLDSLSHLIGRRPSNLRLVRVTRTEPKLRRQCIRPGRASISPERELVVLRYLPTMFKTAEIASDLLVSVNTVKTHQQSIYRKLGVSTRRDAVDRARALELLP